jgi:hypothetical protein
MEQMRKSLSHGPFPITRCAHVTYSDREETEHQMDDLNDPVKFAGHKR